MDTSKVIRGVVNSGRYTVTAPIVKENYGIYLQIEGAELPETYQVDFSNEEHHGTSVTMIGNADGVRIPRQFIDTGKDIFAFLYWVGEDYGKTVYKFRIPNKLRPDRTDETPTPEEQSVIDQAISALNEAVAQTAQDVVDAEASAQSASQSAENAHDSAVDAQNYAESASGYASDAQGYANTASQKATAASQSEEAARGYAQTASEKADAITGLTAQATTLPDGSSATANYNPETGVMSFGIPKGKDGTDGDDGYSPTASVTKSGKVATITITDKNGTTSAQVEDGEDGTDGIDGISPSVSVTDITGGHRVVITDKDGTKSFDVEDGETGATPNLTIGTVETLEPTDDATATITGTPENPVLNLGIPQGDAGEVTTEEFLKAFPTDTASGAIASFSDGADDLPLKSLIVDINPVQDLSHGDPSPENLCPISGWTDVNVEQRGVNVWDEEWELANINWSTSVFTPATNGGRLASKNYIPVVEGNYYCNYTRAQTFLAGYTDDNGNGGRELTVDSNTNIVTIPSDVHFIKFGIATSYYGNTYNNDISINYPSTDHSYHPYTGRSITIQLGQTVYGGKLDVLTGELVIDMAMVDLGTFDWTYNDTHNRFVTSALAAIIKPSDNTKKGNIVCSLYKKETANHTADPAYDNTIGVGSTGAIVIRDTSYTDATAFKAMLTANNAQLVYELATPIEIQLSANQINSLYGVNNLWADSGDTEVEYRADTKAWIQRKIAEAIASLT